MSAPDGMIGAPATRNFADFQMTGLDLVSPWDFQ
jgi:hypothetical protein